MKCTRCGFDNQFGAAFCSQCGQSLNQPNTPPEASAQTNIPVEHSAPEDVPPDYYAQPNMPPEYYKQPDVPREDDTYPNTPPNDYAPPNVPPNYGYAPPNVAPNYGYAPPNPSPSYYAPPNPPPYYYPEICSPFSRWVALILCVVVGVFGVHRFYVGKIGTGILYVFTGGLFGIGWLVDIILIACGTFTDASGLELKL